MIRIRRYDSLCFFYFGESDPAHIIKPFDWPGATSFEAVANCDTCTNHVFPTVKNLNFLSVPGGMIETIPPV